MLPRNRLPNVAPLAAIVLQRIRVVTIGSEQLPSDRAGGLEELRLVLDVPCHPNVQKPSEVERRPESAHRHSHRWA